jgi:uncharacterized ion transporter superfamily protein YfcC
MKANISFNTLVMIFAVVALVAAATWIVPGGEYKRELKTDEHSSYQIPLRLPKVSRKGSALC